MCKNVHKKATTRVQDLGSEATNAHTAGGGTCAALAGAAWLRSTASRVRERRCWTPMVAATQATAAWGPAPAYNAERVGRARPHVVAKRRRHAGCGRPVSGLVHGVGVSRRTLHFLGGQPAGRRLRGARRVGRVWVCLLLDRADTWPWWCLQKLTPAMPGGVRLVW